MIIDRVINNNTISATDDGGREIVIMGCGIGFHAKAGDLVKEEKIEKVFRIDNSTVKDKLMELLGKVPTEIVQVSLDIIDQAKDLLQVKLSQGIYVTLTDHIHFSIERFRQGIALNNALLWDIKRFYPKEFMIGMYAIEQIEKRFQISFPEDEAGFIALHFVNAEYGTQVNETVSFTLQMKEILQIVSKEMHVTLDEGTLHYDRFVTHIKFLLQRVYRKELLNDDDEDLAQGIQRKYPAEFACSEKIADYIESQTSYRLSLSEVMFLAIHIRRTELID